MKKRSKTKKTLDRIVYEINTPTGVTHIDVATTIDLKTRLSELLPLEAYSLQAVAHLVHHERAMVQGQNWGVKRVGVLTFMPDHSSTTTPQNMGGTETPSVAPNDAPDWPKLL